MSFLEEFQQHNRDVRDAYVSEAIEEAVNEYAISVARALKAEKIKEDKAKKILVEGFDIKPSLATEIWNRI